MGLNSANEIQRLRFILKSSVLGTSKMALASTHSLMLSKDSTGIHSERGLLGSDGGNTSNRARADLNGSASDAGCMGRSDSSSVFFGSAEGTESCGVDF